MVLMIFAVSSLAVEISRMDPVKSSMDLLASSTTCLVSFIRELAWWALSAFCRVMAAISSKEEVVSCSAAACWEAPLASWSLELCISPEAEATCSEAAVSRLIKALMGWVMPRVMRTMKMMLSTTPMMVPNISIREELLITRSTFSALFVVSPIPALAVVLAISKTLSPTCCRFWPSFARVSKPVRSFFILVL